MLGISPQDEADATLACAFGDVRDALGQKRVVPQVGVGIKRHRRKEDHHWLLQMVGHFHGDIERRVIERSLGALHPVHDAASLGVGSAGATNRDPGI